MFFKKFFKGLLLASILLLSLPLTANDWLYTVRPNEQASIIGNKYLINPYRIDEVLKYNEIDSPEKLLPGTVLKIPLNYLKFGPARVQVLSVQGEVLIIRKNKTEALTTLSSISLGDKIITNKASSVMMRFADKSELLLGSEAELIFDVLTQWGRTGMVDSRMRLLKGSVEGRVETLDGPGAHFEVHTPSAVATVRGTEFRVRVGKDNTEVTYNEVSEGKVQVENNVAPLLVPEGFGTVSEKGKKAEKPIELLAPPVFTMAATSYPAKPVSLQWQPDSNAVAYRVELFTDADFKNQVDSIKVENNQIDFNEIKVGFYAVRVRAIDLNGLEGLDAKHQFELNGAPEAPINLYAKNEVIAGDKLEFQWEPASESLNYILEIAKDEAFESLVATKEADVLTAKILQDIAPGQYYWRVIASNDYGKGYPSQSEILNIGLPEKPQIKDVTDAELGNEVIVTTSSIAFADSYEWQLSRDEKFSSIISTQKTDNPELIIKDLELGNYYVRVAANGPHNKERFSEAKTFQVYEKGNGKTPWMLSSLLLILLAL